MDGYLKRLQETIRSVTDGMTQEALTQHPPGKWSVAEILEHLYLSYTGTCKGFTRCLEAGKPLASEPMFKQRLRIMQVIELGYLPNGRKAPDRVRPRGMPVETVMREICPQLEAMDKLIGESEARYGVGVRVMDHPLIGPLTARQWRKFHWVHGCHHMKQIVRLKRES
jgi:hypothetical protein